MNKIIFVKTIIFVYVISLISPFAINAYYPEMSASIVIGQPDFYSGDANQGGSPAANTLNSPRDVHYDRDSGKLIIADANNNRVLIFNSVPKQNNASADVVVGQPDFSSNSANQGGSPAANTLYSPKGVFTHGGKLYIVDGLNHRVLIYNSIPTENNTSADVVVGQPDFSSNSANQGGSPAANTLNNPQRLFVDSERMIVTMSNRALIYSPVPTESNASATVVIGQDDFVTQTNQPVNSQSVSSFGVYVADGKLLIGDVTRFRVLVWNTIPTENNQPADVVIGQPDFTSSGSQPGGYNVRRPWDFAYDGKRLFIVHDFTAIVSVRNYGVPTSNFQPQSYYLGFSNVTTNDAQHFWEPRGLAISDTQLFVSDSLHYHRIMIFNDIFSTPGLTLNGPEIAPEGKKKIYGNVILGDRDKYSLDNIYVSVNGSSDQKVKQLDSGVNYGENERLYEFYHEFEPWMNFSDKNSWDEGKGYTLKVTAKNLDAETDGSYIFSPFDLDEDFEVPSRFRIKVSKYHKDNIKNNVNSFSIKIDGNDLLTDISPDLIDDEGNLDINYNSIGANVLETYIEPGEHNLQAVAITDIGNEVYSNQQTFTTDTPIYTNAAKSSIGSSWFPLQINKIAGKTINPISSFNLNTYEPLINISSSSTEISGIAFAGSKVKLLVKNSDYFNDFKVYETTADSSSNFSFYPEVYDSSIIFISAEKDGQYTSIPSFVLE